MGYPKLSLITYNNNDKMLASREDGRKGRITLVPSNVCLYFSPVFDNKINLISFYFGWPILSNVPFKRTRLKFKTVQLMKRIIFLFSILAILVVSISSCTSMRKDCQGKRHYRTANGIYV